MTIKGKMSSSQLFKGLAFCCLFLVTAVSAFGQQYLYLVKKGDVPYKRMGLYEELHIKTVDGEDWVSGKIQAISKKSITLGRVTYPFEEIEAMRTYNSLLRIGGYAFGIGGVMFPGIALFNRGVNGDSPLLFPGQIITGVALLASGGVLYGLSRKTYRKKKGWEFRVIDLNE